MAPENWRDREARCGLWHHGEEVEAALEPIGQVLDICLAPQLRLGTELHAAPDVFQCILPATPVEQHLPGLADVGHTQLGGACFWRGIPGHDFAEVEGVEGRHLRSASLWSCPSCHWYFDDRGRDEKIRCTCCELTQVGKSIKMAAQPQMKLIKEESCQVSTFDRVSN